MAILTILNDSFSAAHAQDLTFQQITFYEGRGPECVVAADVNGDGAPDLIWANSLDNTFFVLTNNYNNSGRFFIMTQLSVGNGPAFVAAADVNGDGKLDLITANEGDDTLTVVTNNGSGVFGFNSTIHVGSDPLQLIAVDLNGDGKMDLVSALTGGYPTYSGGLVLFTNNGSGVLISNAMLNTGAPTVCAAAADLNGDGHVDLIAANGNANTLIVFTNNGSGVFSSNATVFVATEWPGYVGAADVTGDGKADLFTASYTKSGVTLLVNTTPFFPRLNLATIGNQLKLNWQSWATNYVLEATTNLTAPNWTPVTNPAPVGSSITLTNIGPAQFFRLKSQ
jgi:hypothetical protein